ncbi:MAG: UDP-N-acetylglucosamine 1-carboxyvinyltransferase [Brotaphodocola sp.]
MSGILVRGLHRLKGEITIQGSKNAVLPVMAASLLHKGTIKIDNVPKIQDVFCMMGILESLGCVCQWSGHAMVIDTTGLKEYQIPESEARKMRSSVMLLGPLLGRVGEAKSWCPGGCSIGKRPIDLHFAALSQMGATVNCDGSCIAARTTGLHGADIRLSFPSVGATENVVMAAAAAEGVTVLHQAAREPEIEILCRFLHAMGVDIEGIGSSVLKIHGGKPLHDTEFQIPGDRIVAGTYMGAVTAAGGEVYLRDVPPVHLTAVSHAAEQMGAEVKHSSDGIFLAMKKRPSAVELETCVYPGFPTDLQSVFVAAAAVADGTSFISEQVFEERFAAAKELRKLGAHIIIENRTVCIDGLYPLNGAAVTAPDLRGGAALVVAGLAAQGETFVAGDGHIRRGYEDICRDLQHVGADICWKE